MKILVIGPSLSGKTTIIRYIRKNYENIPVAEIDEELTILNSYEYPTDNEHKNNILAPKVIDKILKLDSIIFFTNTDYFSTNDLVKAKKNGFRIVLLNTTLEELKKRNSKRQTQEGYANMAEWLEGMLAYSKRINNEGLVDQIIDSKDSTEEIVNQLIN